MTTHDQDPKSPMPESPLREYIAEQGKFFQEQFADSPEDLLTIQAAISFLEQGDAKNHAEVGYHGPEHVLSMARFAVQIIDSAKYQELLEKLNLDEAKKKSFRKCIAVAAILHDIGYYDNAQTHSFGTRKVGHEERSIAFIMNREDELGLNHEEALMVSTMVEGTIFGRKKKLSPITQENISAEEAGATVLGVLDILGADDHYIRNIALGLFDEFSSDKSALEKQIGINRKKLRILLAYGDSMASEHSKIPLAESRLEQVKASRDFFEYIAKPRINQTGLAVIETAGDQVTMASDYLPTDILASAVRNWQAIYDYASRDIKPSEISDIQ